MVLKLPEEERLLRSRLFVALDLPEQARSRLRDRVDRELSVLCDEDSVRWTPLSDYHLTLAFLGGASVDRTLRLAEALQGIAGRFTPFEVDLVGWGVFPDRGPVSVAWVGVERGVEMVKTVAAAVRDSCVASGFRQERRSFRPHVTVGRAGGSGRGPEGFPYASSQAAIEAQITSFSLYRNRLPGDPGEGAYIRIESYPLA